MPSESDILQELFYLFSSPKGLLVKRTQRTKNKIYSLMTEFWRQTLLATHHHDKLIVKKDRVVFFGYEVYTIVLSEFEKKSIGQTKATFDCVKSGLDSALKFAANVILEGFLLKSGLYNNYSYDSLPTNVNKQLPELTKRNYIRNPIVDTIRNFFVDQNYHTILVYGNSASGKSVAVAQTVTRLETIGYSKIWIDLSDVGINIPNLVYTILTADTNNKHIIVIDNAQACPSKLLPIKKVIDTIAKLFANVSITTIIVGWTSAKGFITSVYPNIKSILCEGDTLIDFLVEKNSLDDYSMQIKQSSCGDTLVAYNFIKFIKENSRYPLEKEISVLIYNDCVHRATLTNEAQKAIYTIAALGEFEIHVRDHFVRSITESGYKELLDCNLLRVYLTDRNETFVSIGHRSMAHKIVSYFYQSKADFIQSPIELAINYLQIEGNHQIHSTLERLDLELVGNDNLFGDLWQAFLSVKSCVFRQMYDDATWGENMASMIFAAEVLKYMSFDSHSRGFWSQAVRLIRSRWEPVPEKKQINYIGKKTTFEGGITSEIVDFTNSISKTMSEEEKCIIYPKNMLSNNIDYRKFHDNWLLGLLLGFEGIAYDNDKTDLKDKYINCAYSMQEPNGSFYPQRVYWVTARVIIGLCQCGLTYTDQIVKDSCNWLIGQFTTDPKKTWSLECMDCGGWLSGTGKWNSNEQVTLICLSALLHAKYPINRNRELQKTINCIWGNIHELNQYFITNNTPLDTMWVIDVMMFSNKDLFEMKNEIKSMTTLVRNIWNQASKLSDSKETESSDVSFMAKQLLGIIWVMLTNNIEKLLKGLEFDYGSGTDVLGKIIDKRASKVMTTQKERKFKIGFTFTGEHRVDKVCPVLNELLKSKKFEKNDIFYDRWHPALINGIKGAQKLQNIYLNNCDVVVVFLSAEYDNKTWTGGVEWRAILEIINSKAENKAVCLINADGVDISVIDGLFSHSDIATPFDHYDVEGISNMIIEIYDDLR